MVEVFSGGEGLGGVDAPWAGDLGPMDTLSGLSGRLDLLRLPGLAILLDLSLGHILVLRADHPKDWSSRILAAGYRAQLLRAFSAGFSKQAEVGDLGRPAGAASATTEGAFDSSASTFLALAIEEVGELSSERIDE